MSRTLTLGFSPCPNDTFIFHALLHGLVDTGGLGFDARLLDVQTLNETVRAGGLDISKVSHGAAPGLAGGYEMLRSGGALGRGCGPLIVGRPGGPGLDGLRGGRIAVPGFDTTAWQLMRMYDQGLAEGAVAMPFDAIMGEVAGGRADAGLIIHEGRFTYPAYGLVELLDLGRWWEGQTGGGLIPLGCIVARRGLGEALIRRVEGLIARSARYALENPGRSRAYVKAHAQEMADDVIEGHIGLYVNEYSVDMGEEGEMAVREFQGRIGFDPARSSDLYYRL